MQDYEKIAAVFYDTMSRGTPGDLDFYVAEAKKSGGPVLELGCGTGRILIPTAESGIEIVGLDLSPDMLTIAREKVSKLADVVQSRITLLQGDMVDFSLDRKFKLITIPYRAFLHILASEDQKKALACIREHLTDDGRLILNIFDPRLDILADPTARMVKHLGDFKHPITGNNVAHYDIRHYDPNTQILNAYFIFEELDTNNTLVSKTYAPLNLRWIYRWEMQYLLELSGFEVEALYRDFNGTPFSYGSEQVWVAKKSS